MYQFLVRIGKTKFGKNVMPAMCCLATTVYGSVQFLLHDQMRDLLAAQAPSGRRERISDYLRHLIEEAHERAKEEGFSVDNYKNNKLNFTPSSLKWFVSSTLEPVNFGMARFKTGLMIGLPSFYNYSKPSDVPDSVFDIKKLSLLRSPQDSGLEQRQKIEEEAHIVEGVNKDPKLIRRIERNSDEGKDYLDSLLLSDDAKKYSIARELFLGDTFRPLLGVIFFFASCALAVSASRASVILLKTKDRHITTRIPGYMACGIIGIVNFTMVNGAIDQYFAQSADKQAKDLGPEYAAGADEYFAKRAKRNAILGIN